MNIEKEIKFFENEAMDLKIQKELMTPEKYHDFALELSRKTLGRLADVNELKNISDIEVYNLLNKVLYLLQCNISIQNLKRFVKEEYAKS